MTLPGTPLLVAGSNGHIAWGFTNSYGDWVGVQRIECSAVDERGMSTPQGLVPLSVQREEIRVHGAAAAVELVRSGPAGLLLRVDVPATAAIGTHTLAVVFRSRQIKSDGNLRYQPAVPHLIEILASRAVALGRG